MSRNLYCPRCSKPFSSEISYCRTCGLSLDGVSKIVSGEAENAPAMTWRPNFKLMRLGIGLFIFGMVIGLIYGAVRDLGLFPEAYGKMIFLGIIALGMLTMGAGMLFPTKKYTRSKPLSADRSDPDAGLDTASLAGQLPSAQVGVNDIEFPKDAREFDKVAACSVTEHTTRNLEQKAD